MSRTGTLILLGVLTILTPFSGLPIALRTFLSVIFGASVAIIGLMQRAHEAKSRHTIEIPETSDTNQHIEEPAAPTGVSPI